MTPVSEDAAGLLYYVLRDENGFKLMSKTAPAPGATIEFDYQIIQ
jgi:hypothetical protein